MSLKTSRELTDQSVKLLSKFQSGELKPISTGIDHLDEALLGGFIPGTVLGIVARSLHGKTYDAERIAANIMEQHDDVILLHAAWELTHFKLLVRDLVVKTEKSPKEILFETPEGDVLDKFKEVCNNHRKENVIYQNEPVSDTEFNYDVMEIIEKYPDHKILVLIDNLENILMTKPKQKDCMDALLYRINVLKHKHEFISFIVLNQMNQEYLENIDNPKKHRPSERHVYGTDQLFKLCDVLYIKMIPWRLGIRDKFMVFGENQYEYLDEHKLEGNGKTTSFDPYGRAFYFYLKNRMPEDGKNLKDIHVEVMWTREETGEEPPKVNLTSAPTFTNDKNSLKEDQGKEKSPIFEEPKFDPVKFNTSPEDAFGENNSQTRDNIPF